MRKTERILSAMLALILTLTMSMGGTVSAADAGSAEIRASIEGGDLTEPSFVGGMVLRMRSFFSAGTNGETWPHGDALAMTEYQNGPVSKEFNIVKTPAGATATASGGYDDQGRQIVSVEVLGAADADGNIPVRAAAVNPGEATVVYTIRKSGYSPATVEQKVQVFDRMRLASEDFPEKDELIYAGTARDFTYSVSGTNGDILTENAKLEMSPISAATLDAAPGTGRGTLNAVSAVYGADVSLTAGRIADKPYPMYFYDDSEALGRTISVSDSVLFKDLKSSHPGLAAALSGDKGGQTITAGFTYGQFADDQYLEFATVPKQKVALSIDSITFRGEEIGISESGFAVSITGDTGIARLTVPKTAGAGDYAIRLLASRPNAYLETPLTVNLTVAQAQFTGVGLAYSTGDPEGPAWADAVDGKISAKFNARYEKAFDVSLTSGDERPNGVTTFASYRVSGLPESASFEGNVLSLSGKNPVGSYLIPVTLYDPAGNYADAELALTYQVDNTYTIALKDVTGNLVGNAEIVNGSDIVATVHLPYEDVTGSNKLNLVFYQDGEDGRMKAATAAAKLATGEGAVTVKNNVVTVPKRLPVLAEGETYDLVTTVSADNYNDARLTVKIIVDKAAITVTDVASSTTNSSYQTIAPAADGETYEADRFAYGENKYFRITSDSKSSAQFTAASLVSADEPETDLRDAYLVKESFAKGKSLIQLAPGLPTGDYELTLTGESSSSDKGGNYQTKTIVIKFTVAQSPLSVEMQVTGDGVKAGTGANNFVVTQKVADSSLVYTYRVEVTGPEGAADTAQVALDPSSAQVGDFDEATGTLTIPADTEPGVYTYVFNGTDKSFQPGKVTLVVTVGDYARITRITSNTSTVKAFAPGEDDKGFDFRTRAPEGVKTVLTLTRDPANAKVALAVTNGRGEAVKTIKLNTVGDKIVVPASQAAGTYHLTMEVTHASRSAMTYTLDLRVVGKNEITSIHNEKEVYSTVPADGAATLDIDLSKLNDFDGAFLVATNEGTTHIDDTIDVENCVPAGAVTWDFDTDTLNVDVTKAGRITTDLVVDKGRPSETTTRLTVNVIPAVTVTDKSGELALSDGVYTAESKAGEGNQITIAANPSAGCTVETSLSSAEIQQLLQNKKITVLGNVITVANDAPAGTVEIPFRMSGTSDRNITLGSGFTVRVRVGAGDITASVSSPLMDAPAVVTENKVELTHGYGADEVFTISTTPETTLSLVSESVNNLIFNSANKTVTAKANLAAGTYTLRLKAEAQYYTPFLFDVVVEVVPVAEVAWTVAGADGAEISPDKTGVYQLPVNRSEGGSFTVSTVPANAKVTRTDKNAEITSGDNRTFTVPANLSGDSLQVTLKGTNKNYLPSEITISVNLVSDARLTPAATVGDKTYYADADGVISVTLKDLEKAALSTNAADAVITKQISEQAGFNIANSGVRANGAKAGTYDFPFRATAENYLDTDFTLRVTIAPIVEYKVDDDTDYAAVTERTVEVGYGDGAQIPVLAKLANGDNAVTLSAGATPLYTAWSNGVLTILPSAPAGSYTIKLTPRADGVSIPGARLTLTVKVLSGRIAVDAASNLSGDLPKQDGPDGVVFTASHFAGETQTITFSDKVGAAYSFTGTSWPMGFALSGRTLTIAPEAMAGEYSLPFQASKKNYEPTAVTLQVKVATDTVSFYDTKVAVNGDAQQASSEPSVGAAVDNRRVYDIRVKPGQTVSVTTGVNIAADRMTVDAPDGWTVSKIDSTVTFSFPETAVTGETYTVKVDYPRSVDNRATQAVVNMTAVDKSQLAQPIISSLSLAVDPSDETSGTVTVSWNAVEGAAYYQLYAGGELKVETDSASARLGIGAGYAGSLPTVEENASLTVKAFPAKGSGNAESPVSDPKTLTITRTALDDVRFTGTVSRTPADGKTRFFFQPVADAAGYAATEDGEPVEKALIQDSSSGGKYYLTRLAPGGGLTVGLRALAKEGSLLHTDSAKESFKTYQADALKELTVLINGEAVGGDGITDTFKAGTLTAPKQYSVAVGETGGTTSIAVSADDESYKDMVSSTDGVAVEVPADVEPGTYAFTITVTPSGNFDGVYQETVKALTIVVAEKDSFDVSGAALTLETQFTADEEVKWVRASWDAVPNAESYDLLVNGTLVEHTAKTAATILPAKIKAGDTVSVVAKAPGYNDGTPVTAVYEYAPAKLAAPVVTFVYDGETGELTASWEAVEGAAYYRVDPSADWGDYNTTNNQALTAVRNIQSGTAVDYPIAVWAMARSGSAKYADSDRTEAVYHYDRPTLTADTTTTTINHLSSAYPNGKTYTIKVEPAGAAIAIADRTPSVPGIVPNQDGTISIYSTAKETGAPLIYDATATLDGYQTLNFQIAVSVLPAPPATFQYQLGKSGEWTDLTDGQTITATEGEALLLYLQSDNTGFNPKTMIKKDADGSADINVASAGIYAPGSAPAGSASFTITVPENDLFAETTLHFTVEIAEKPALDLSGMTTAYTYSLKGAESIQYSKVITDEVRAAYPGATVGFSVDPSVLNYGPAKPVGGETYTVTVSNVAGHKDGSFEVTITVVDDRDELSVDDFTFTHPYKKTSTAYPVAVDGAAVTVTTTPLPAGISWRSDNSTLYVNSDAKVGEYTLDATASKPGMKDASFRIIVTVTDERQGLTILLNGGAVTADPVETPYGVRKDFALSTAESLTSPTIELTTTDEAGKVNFSKDGKTIMIYEGGAEGTTYTVHAKITPTGDDARAYKATEADITFVVGAPKRIEDVPADVAETYYADETGEQTLTLDIPAGLTLKSLAAGFDNSKTQFAINLSAKTIKFTPSNVEPAVYGFTATVGKSGGYADATFTVTITVNDASARPEITLNESTDIIVDLKDFHGETRSFTTGEGIAVTLSGISSAPATGQIRAENGDLRIGADITEGDYAVTAAANAAGYKETQVAFTVHASDSTPAITVLGKDFTYVRGQSQSSFTVTTDPADATVTITDARYVGLNVDGATISKDTSASYIGSPADGTYIYQATAAREGYRTANFEVTVAISTKPDEALTIDGNAFSVKQGEGASFTLGFNSQAAVIEAEGTFWDDVTMQEPNRPKLTRADKTITVGTDTPAGTYTLTLNVTGGSGYTDATFTVTVHVQEANAFEIADQKISVEVPEGQAFGGPQTIDFGDTDTAGMTFFVDPTNYGDRIFLGMSGTKALVFLTDDAPEGTFYFMVTAQKDGFSTEFEIALEVVRTAANNLLASPASLEEPLEKAPSAEEEPKPDGEQSMEGQTPDGETPGTETPGEDQSSGKEPGIDVQQPPKEQDAGQKQPGAEPGGDGTGSESKPEVAPPPADSKETPAESGGTTE
ncbi:hypothetical protein D4A47_12395 [Anaerotruncus massiliensis (ex Liu et al. 2021)]|uniref:Uncharacterized protein n=2 Tax=Anaerotruncus TaxID=244127 RepID=A0A498CSJ4_9FIRM|nr:MULTISPECIES: hypothetical protein [Anaerotruncus]MBC3939733.1 hypothetical protein [Anaerotruncus massiliensis (ex Togo et al. 2019)]RLL08172.1 hypothetical protein D4A47_12395 [Anaerotruncus massiliensis (ex Liu et al. 2021)]